MPHKEDRTDKPFAPFDPFYSTPTPTTTPNKARAQQQENALAALTGGSKSKGTDNNILQPNANPKINSNILQPNANPKVNSSILQPNANPKVNSSILQPNANPKVKSTLNPTASVWTPNTNLSANPDYDGLPFPKKHPWDNKPAGPHIFRDGTPINPPETKTATNSRQEATGSAHGALHIHTKPENVNPAGPPAKSILKWDTADPGASQPSSGGRQKVNHKLAAYGNRVSNDTLAYPDPGWDSSAWEKPVRVLTSLERSLLSTHLNPATMKRMESAGHWLGKDGSLVDGKVKYGRYVSGLEEGMQQEREQADEINRITQQGSVFEKNCERADWGWFRERDPDHTQQGGNGGNGGGNGGANGGGGGRGGGRGRADFKGRGGRGGAGSRGRGQY